MPVLEIRISPEKSNVTAIDTKYCTRFWLRLNNWLLKILKGENTGTAWKVKPVDWISLELDNDSLLHKTQNLATDCV